MKRLREVYFPHSNNNLTIEDGNVALMSDIIYGDNILTATVLQTKVNRNAADRTNQKNTFLYRLDNLHTVNC